MADGAYEYDFILDGQRDSPIADPYADEITRFGGYRGVLRMAGRTRVRQAFRWDDEFVPGKPLRQNNEIVIYELPIKWMSSDPLENPLVELGTFESVVFEHLDALVALGVNCIELLPIADTSQTLNWGYGTRFFFAPDYDLGTPLDARYFIKACHRRGVGVILDVVMNFFDKTCPLGRLAAEWFSVPPGTEGRDNFGQILFRYNTPSYGSEFAAREFLYSMAEFWTSNYHVDGFRIDDFADIANWDFAQQFRARSWAAAQQTTPGKPFLVIAEDSRRDFRSTDPAAYNGGKVVDAIWNFGYRDEVRRLLKNEIATTFGQASRSQRVAHVISKDGDWNGWTAGFDHGYADLACSVDYLTSHDVADAPRLMNDLLGSILREQGLGNGDVPQVRAVLDTSQQHPSLQDDRLNGAVTFALYRVLGGFALLLTSVGIPMFLAGEEFADVHDLDFLDVNLKQEDPVQWRRASYPGGSMLLQQVAQLISLRTTHPALQRNDVQSFYFHPQFDANAGGRVFGYCRTAGLLLGSTGQVVVLTNMGPEKYDVYDVPGWPWRDMALTEVCSVASVPEYDAARDVLSMSLDAFQVRLFTT